MTTVKKPTFIAYSVTGKEPQTFWTNIGSAWPHKNGEGFSIELTALPLNGRIVLLFPKTAQE